MNAIEPRPAIVQSAEDREFQTLLMYSREVKGYTDNRERSESDEVLAVFHFGGLLSEAKRKCTHGGWLPLLERLEIPERSAQRYMRIAQLPQAAVEQLGSVRLCLEYCRKFEEARRAGKTPPDPAKMRKSDTVSDLEFEDANAAAQSPTTKPCTKPSASRGQSSSQSDGAGSISTGHTKQKPQRQQPEIDYDPQATARRQNVAKLRCRAREAVKTLEHFSEIIIEMVQIDHTGEVLRRAKQSNLHFTEEEVFLQPDPERPMEPRVMKRKVWSPVEEMKRLLSQIADGREDE